MNGSATCKAMLATGTIALLLVAAGTATAGVWGHWPLNDGQGNDAVDLGPRSETGVIGNDEGGGLGQDGSIWFDDIERGIVTSFNGNADSAYVYAGDMPDTLTTEPENDFTWAFWARQDEDQVTPSNDVILGNRYAFNGTDTVPREFVKFTANRFEYHMNEGIAVERNPDGTEQYHDDLQYLDCDFCPERHIPSDPSEWLHHAVVKDGENLTYYRNGELWNSDVIETDQLSAAPLPIFFGGINANVATENWRGLISDVWLFDEALSGEAILDIMTGDQGVPGDFNGSGGLDAPDIDQLTTQSASLTNPATYDLNTDSLVNEADVKVWISDLYISWVGDANLDSEFNSTDLIVVLAAGTYETVGPAVWTSGDFNGDGLANSSDLVAALADGGYEIGPRTPAVPEPTGLLLAVLGLLGMVARRK